MSEFKVGTAKQLGLTDGDTVYLWCFTDTTGQLCYAMANDVPNECEWVAVRKNGTVWESLNDDRRVHANHGAKLSVRPMAVQDGDAARRLDYWAEEWQGHQRLADSAKDNLRSAVALAHSSGMSEVVIARRAGVSRMTIRKWLGKR